MAKYLFLKHYRAGPTPTVDSAPMQAAPAKVQGKSWTSAPSFQANPTVKLTGRRLGVAPTGKLVGVKIVALPNGKKLAGYKIGLNPNGKRLAAHKTGARLLGWRV